MTAEGAGNMLEQQSLLSADWNTSRRTSKESARPNFVCLAQFCKWSKMQSIIPPSGKESARPSSVELEFWKTTVCRSLCLLSLTYAGIPLITCLAYKVVDDFGAVPAWIYLFPIAKTILALGCQHDFENRLDALLPQLAHAPWGVRPGHLLYDDEQDLCELARQDVTEQALWEQARKNITKWRVGMSPRTWLNLLDYKWILYASTLCQVLDQDTDAMNPWQINAVLTPRAVEEFTLSWKHWPFRLGEFLGGVGLPRMMLSILAISWCAQVGAVLIAIFNVLCLDPSDDKAPDTRVFYQEVGKVFNFCCMPLAASLPRQLNKAKVHKVAKPGGMQTLILEQMPQLWLTVSGWALVFDDLSTLAQVQIACGFILSYFSAASWAEDYVAELCERFGVHLQVWRICHANANPRGWCLHL